MTSEPTIHTLQQSFDDYHQIVTNSRSANTERTYHQAVLLFARTLQEHSVLPASVPTSEIKTEWLKWYMQDLRTYAVATEQLYLTALAGWYEFVAAERHIPINLSEVRLLIRRRQRRKHPRIPRFPREQIETLLERMNEKAIVSSDNNETMRCFRDRALMFVLADTGLRISEACSLRKSQFVEDGSRAIVTIKGGRESLVRFSERAMRAIRAYTQLRSTLLPTSTADFPIFARHDKGSGKRVLPLSQLGARQAVEKWVCDILGESAKGTITPHSFRHYYVTYVLRASGGNLRLAQELARHKNITITQRYAHLSDQDLDETYQKIFNPPAP